MKDNLGMTGLLVAGFVLLLLGAVLVGPISTETLTVTEKTDATQAITIIRNTSQLVAGGGYSVNGSVNTTLTNAPTGWKLQDCPLTSVVVTNNSGTALTITTDYIVDLVNGRIRFVNSTNLGIAAGAAYDNITNVRYDYCADSYLNAAWNRSVLELVPGFFAIAIMIAGVGIFFAIGRKAEII